MFINFGAMFVVVLLGVPCLLAVPTLAVMGARTLPAGFSRLAFFAFAVGLAGPLYWMFVALQRQVISSVPASLAALDLVFLAASPWLLRYLVIPLRPRSWVNVALVMLGVIGGAATAMHLYAAFAS